jgi:NDP-4-keto-2,6-dideoxyhexose 3-C-methyltransferase
MKIHKCRNCNKKIFFNLFSLGKISYTGKFPKNEKIDIPKEEIKLIMCSSCKLVQISKNFSLSYMYNQDYGYRTGINHTMSNHVKKLVKKINNIFNLKKDNVVLDIASNDGTLLNYYPPKIIKVGVDPLVNKYKKNYKNIDYKYSSFFEKKLLDKKILQKKIDVITALSVFYDLKEPNIFLKQISNIINQRKGIFVLEHADLLSIIKNNLFDTICHEHLAYYSVHIISDMCKKNNLHIFDIEKNNINGGSTRFYICHKQAKYKVLSKKIAKFLKTEKKNKIDKLETYKKFFLRINSIKKKLNSFLLKKKQQGKKIHGYGASTKGNLLLQYFDIGKNIISKIAERNPNKVGSFTPGLKIPIVSEETSRSEKPDLYLVLPWHFKEEILLREKKMLRQKCKFIFPLPNIKVY